MRNFTLSILVAAGFIAGMAPRAEAQGETAPVPATAAAADAPAAVADNAAPWWTRFGDSTLEALVAEGLSASPAMNAGRQRVVQSQELAGKTLAPVLPSLTAQVNTITQPFSNRDFPEPLPKPAGKTGSDIFHSGTASLNLNLQLDIWGRNYTGYTAARSDADAAGHNLDAATLDHAAAVSQAYFNLIAARVQLRLTREQLRTNQSLLEIIEARYNNGQVTAVDLLQQRQLEAASLARVPQAEMALSTGEEQLMVLLGRGPGQDLPTLPALLPEPPPPVDRALAYEQLETSRPDLRAASLVTQSAEDRASSSTRGFLPRFSVGGQAGYQGLYIDELQYDEYWQVNANLTLPIYEGGSNWAGYYQAHAAYSEAEFNQYRSRLQARLDMRTAAVAFREMTRFLEAMRNQEKSARLAFEKSRERYLAGVESYTGMLATLTTYQQVQISTLAAHRDLLTASVRYYNALGGDWTLGISARTGSNQP